MSSKYVSIRNVRFLLHEVFDVESLCELPPFCDHSRETFEMVIDAAVKMATNLLFPALSEMDRDAPAVVDGEVRVHPMIRTFLKEAGDGGWIGAPFDYQHGGQQIPQTVFAAFRFILSAANYSASVFPALTTGAAHLILSFGSPELAETYAPRMLAGTWQGTMALTEPQAGSSLTDITTSAEPTPEGYYKIRGQKIFISAADHDAVENVVNLTLARIKGAPPGIKGISLFVIPKRRPNQRGELESNDVTCVTLYHKLGYRGTPLTQLALGDNDDCRGYLVGQEHKGLSYMFQMMNEARIDVGMGAAAIASAAYYASLQYTRERPQGRKVTERDLAKPQIPIIEHADIKRMLLFQRAIVEGSLGLVLQLSKYTDLLAAAPQEDAERYSLLLDLLTPIVKTYPSEMGILSVSQGLQCLGGYGYCDEFQLEQYYRDIRIHTIHEGTTGIQALDLLGRKIVRNAGRASYLYLEEVRGTIDAARSHPQLEPYACMLDAATQRLAAVTAHLVGLALEGKVELFLADATLYLELFSIICIAWQWLLQASVAQKALDAGAADGELAFYKGKVQTFRYFFEYELPKTEGLARTLERSTGVTLETEASHFDD